MNLTALEHVQNKRDYLGFSINPLVKSVDPAEQRRKTGLSTNISFDIFELICEKVKSKISTEQLISFY